MAGKTSEVEALLERYPDKRLPYGAAAEVAREVGVSRQLVFTVANRLGYERESRAPVRKCRQCNRSTRVQTGICARCSPRKPQYIEVKCAGCDVMVRRLKSALNSQRASRGYTGKIFHSRECAAAYYKGVPLAERSAN